MSSLKYPFLYVLVQSRDICEKLFFCFRARKHLRSPIAKHVRIQRFDWIKSTGERPSQIRKSRADHLNEDDVMPRSRSTNQKTKWGQNFFLNKKHGSSLNCLSRVSCYSNIL